MKKTRLYFLISCLFFVIPLIAIGHKSSTEINKQNRFDKFEYIDSIAYLCSDTVYREYLQGGKIQKSEPSYKILTNLDKSVEKVLRGISSKSLNKGSVVVWSIYNMGYIIQTDKGSIGIDIHCRDAKRFAKYIDALLITHSHNDHYRKDLIEEMERLNKPVISNWVDNPYKCETERSFKIGNFDISTHLGNHYFWEKESQNDMLMFVVATNGTKILHTGDNSSLEKLEGLPKVDLFILHHDIIKSLPEAVKMIQPKLTILSHVMELGHPRTVNGYRWTFTHALAKSFLLKDARHVILFWGDKIRLK